MTARRPQPYNRDDFKRQTLMSQEPRQATWIREELLNLLSVSGTLAGLCITGVTLFHTTGRTSLPETLADDVLAVSALLFLLCTYAIFIALRTRREKVAALLEKAADTLFLLALSGMVCSGFIMAYTLI